MEVEEVRQKESTAKKFGYASITFDTFKPSNSRPPSYQPELDIDQRNRLPSFARNYNPAANRVQLARSYEVVTLMNKPPANEATNAVAGASKAGAENGPREEYDTLSYPERKPTMTSQRNFSISQAEYATDYSQLQLQKKPKQKMAIVGEPASIYQNEKPIPRQRSKFPKPALLSSYSSVKKSSPPPLPPPYNPTSSATNDLNEDHYKVPKSYREIENGYYDRPSSLVRVARSCENLGHAGPQFIQHEGATASSIYDMPSSISPPLARQLEMEAQLKSLNSLFSQDSYIDMSATQV